MTSLKNLQKLAKQQKLSITGKTGNYKIYKGKTCITNFRTLTEIKNYLETTNHASTTTEVSRIAGNESQIISDTGSKTNESFSTSNTGDESIEKRLSENNPIIEVPCGCINGNFNDNQPNPISNWQVIDSFPKLDCATLHTIQPTTITTEKNHEQIQQQQTGSEYQRIEGNTLSERSAGIATGLQDNNEKISLAQQICTDEYVEQVIEEIEQLLHNLLDDVDFNPLKAFAIAGDILIPARLNRHDSNQIMHFYRHTACDNYRLIAYAGFTTANDEFYGVLFHDRITGFYFDSEGCYKSVRDYLGRLDINDNPLPQITDDNWLALSSDF
jgi:hypothetical protein